MRIVRYWYPLLIIVLLTAVLAIPESRRTLSMELWCVRNIDLSHGLSHTGWSVFSPLHYLPAEKALRSSPAAQENLSSKLGRLHVVLTLSGRPDIFAKDMAWLRTEDRTDIYACALNVLTRKALFDRPSSVKGSYQPEPKEANPEAAKEMLSLSTKGSLLEPENAYFDLTAAYALLGLHRDDEAILAVRRAARKSRYNSHYLDLYKARTYFLQKEGIPQLESFCSEMTVSYGIHTALDRVGDACRQYAQRKDEEGQHIQAKEILTDLVSVAGLIRGESSVEEDWNGARGINRHVGLYIADLSNDLRRDSPDDYPNRIVGGFNSRGWKEIAEGWKQGYLSGKAFASGRSTAFNLLNTDFLLVAIGSKFFVDEMFLLLSISALISWAVCSLLVRRMKIENGARLTVSRRHYLSMILFGVAPCIVITWITAFAFGVLDFSDCEADLPWYVELWIGEVHLWPGGLILWSWIFSTAALTISALPIFSSNRGRWRSYGRRKRWLLLGKGLLLLLLLAIPGILGFGLIDLSSLVSADAHDAYYKLIFLFLPLLTLGASAFRLAIGGVAIARRRAIRGSHSGLEGYVAADTFRAGSVILLKGVLLSMLLLHLAYLPLRAYTAREVEKINADKVGYYLRHAPPVEGLRL